MVEKMVNEMNKSIIFVAAGILLLAACGPAAAPTASAQAYDPNEDHANTPDAQYVKNWHDWRRVGHEIRAVCDRGNLIYSLKDGYRGGLAVVPNSPQCSRSTRPSWTAVEP